MTGRHLRPLRRRRDQRGQILVMVALMAVVIFGAVALGVDPRPSDGDQTQSAEHLRRRLTCRGA